MFIHNALRTFVRTDRDILASAHAVEELDLSNPVKLLTLPARLAHSDLVFAWFASLHSLLPLLGSALLRKPSIVVVGGYDTANMPEIGYGHMAHAWKEHVVRLDCKSATALVANSFAAADEVRTNTATATPLHVFYHGFAAPVVPLRQSRERIALSVGNINRSNLARKGHESFVRAASLVPEARFVLAGRPTDDAIDHLRAIATPNVEFPGFLAETELNDLYGRAAVYVQASAHEGFGCAVAEAMLAGCIPVVTRSGALPEVVGDHGVFVERGDSSALAEAVRGALGASAEQRFLASQHIVTHFPLEARRKGLLRLVTDIAGKQSTRVRVPLAGPGGVTPRNR